MIASQGKASASEDTSRRARNAARVFTAAMGGANAMVILCLFWFRGGGYVFFVGGVLVALHSPNGPRSSGSCLCGRSPPSSHC